MKTLLKSSALACALLCIGLVVSVASSQSHFSKLDTRQVEDDLLSQKAKVHVSADGFDVIWSNKDDLFNPYQLFVQDDVVVVYDADGDAPFLSFDMEGRLLRQIGGWGEGPGEFGERPRIAGRLSDTHIALSDGMRRRVARFNVKTGEYEGEVRVPSSSGPPAISGNTIIVRSETPGLFAQGVVVDPSFKSTSESGSPIPFGTYEELPEVSFAEKNYLLKQGPATADAEGGTYVALRYTDLIMAFEPDGTLRFKSHKPFNISLPKFSAEDISIPGVTAASPPVNVYPSLFIGLSVSEDRIYALCACKKLESSMSVDEINEGERVYVYNKHNGSLEMSFDLPFPVRDIEVLPDAILAVAVRDDVELIKLSRPF